MSELEAQALVISMLLMAFLGVVLWAYDSVTVKVGESKGSSIAGPTGAREPQGDFRPQSRFGPADAYRSLVVVPVAALLFGVLWWS